MTTADDDQTDSGPGFALPHDAGESSAPMPTNMYPGTGAGAGNDPDSGRVSDETPLTETQQAVVDHISNAQHELGKAERFTSTPRLGVWGGGIGYESVLGAIDRDLHMHKVSNEDDAALFLAEQAHAGESKPPRHIVPDGGPPTPEEVHEAEMNPWPHHNMAETIEHNRQLRVSGQADDGDDGDSGAAGKSGA